MRFKKILANVWRASRRSLDWFPFTPLGLVMGGATYVALRVFAYGKLDLVFLVVGLGAAAAGTLSTAFVVWTSIYLKVRLSRSRRRNISGGETVKTETERRTPTGFSVPSLRFVPFVRVRWSWAPPILGEVRTRRQGGSLLEDVLLGERGEFERIERRLFVEDVFGLCRIGLRDVDSASRFEVLPHVGGLARVPVLSSLAGGDEMPHPMGLVDGDRVELRRYSPGDPARFIHWKIFGRTRRLMVRMPERALSRARRTVAYLVAGPSDEASAAAARVALEQNAFGEEWTFGADGGSTEAHQTQEAVQLVMRSVHARAQGGQGLEAFLTRVERTGPAMAIVFVPARPGPWVEHVLRAASKRRQGFRIVIGVDGVSEDAGKAWLRSLVAIPERSRSVRASELDSLTRTFRSVRAETLVLDRQTGRVLRSTRDRVDLMPAGSARPGLVGGAS